VIRNKALCASVILRVILQVGEFMLYNCLCSLVWNPE